MPSYAAESFFRIGSGDIAAAAFAHAWGELGRDPVEAAHYAARCMAHFVEGPRLALPGVAEVSERTPNVDRRDEIRIVGLGDFELQALVVSTREWLSYLGGRLSHLTFELDDVDSKDAVDRSSRSEGLALHHAHGEMRLLGPTGNELLIGGAGAGWSRRGELD